MLLETEHDDLDVEVELVKGVHKPEIEELVIEVLRTYGPMKFSTLKRMIETRYGVVVGEDTLSNVVFKLLDRDIIVEMPDCALGLPEQIPIYTPSPVLRVRPRHPTKFFKRWGRLYRALCRLGIPIGEALKILKERKWAKIAREVMVHG